MYFRSSSYQKSLELLEKLVDFPYFDTRLLDLSLDQITATFSQHKVTKQIKTAETSSFTSDIPEPVQAYAYYLRGILYMMKSAYIKAIPDFTISIETYPLAISRRERAFAFSCICDFLASCADIDLLLYKKLNQSDEDVYGIEQFKLAE